MSGTSPASFARLHPGKPTARSLAVGILLLSAAFLVAAGPASAADPLGATLHKNGTTTFRVWAPFLDKVAVKINGGPPVPMAEEPGHSDPADTTWVVTVPDTRAGD